LTDAVFAGFACARSLAKVAGWQCLKGRSDAVQSSGIHGLAVDFKGISLK
jgi:hypothetical protein